jgi:hypothetical protein
MGAPFDATEEKDKTVFRFCRFAGCFSTGWKLVLCDDVLADPKG